jgi:Mitochondrial carrier protein.
MQIGDKLTARNVAADITKKQGFFGFYKGFSALCIRELPFDTMQMVTFQTLAYLNLFENGTLGYYINGGIAGGITAIITTPVDVVKTRMMTSPEKFRTFVQSFKEVYQGEGFKALMRGWQVRVMYITIGGMMYFGVFKSSLNFLSIDN